MSMSESQLPQGHLPSSLEGRVISLFPAALSQIPILKNAKRTLRIYMFILDQQARAGDSRRTESTVRVPIYPGIHPRLRKTVSPCFGINLC